MTTPWLKAALTDQRTVVRRATPGDVPSLARVHVQSWRETYRGLISDRFLDAMKVEAYERHWRQVFAARGWAFVAEVEGEVVGFASGGPARRNDHASGEIYVLYLLWRYQKQGLGRALFDACHYELARRGHGSTVVWVLTTNRKARAFYRRLRGKEVGSAHVTVGDERLPEIAYRWDC